MTLHRNSDGELLLDGQSVSALAEGCATPFFLFSARSIRANYEAVRSAFAPAEARVDYCIKTNYELALLRYIRQLGASAMVTCGWEIELALAAGFRPEQLAFHGPGKSEAELELAVRTGVGLIHVYSAGELDQLERIAAAQGRTVDVSVRVPVYGPWLERQVRGWYAERLGVPPSEAHQLLRRVAASRWLQVRGLSVHVGTQVVRAEPYARAIQQLLTLARRLQDEGIAVRELSLGGGWPSDTLQPNSARTLVGALAGQSPPSIRPRLASLARRVAAIYRNEVARAGLALAPAVAIEPGRGLVGSAGYLATRVLRSEGRWVFVDGSHNFLPESALVGRRMVWPVRPSRGRLEWRHLSGRTLNTADIMAVGVRLPPVGPGDLLVFLDAGAYSLSRANRYAGTIPAAYLLEEDGKLQQIRRADQLSDVVAAMTDALQLAGVE